MVNSISKIALAAILGIALAFTLSSCSDDDDGGDGWLSCDEIFKLEENCQKKAGLEWESCVGKGNRDDCEDRVAKIEGKCFFDGACNGTDEYTCEEHYVNEGCFGEE